MSTLPVITGLLSVPRLRVQNANAISSPFTWGFPAITAFTGLAQALERKLAGSLDLQFEAVGVVCHHYQAQTSGAYTQGFHLSRNPVDKDGTTAAIVEEGRIHLDISLLFGLTGEALAAPKEQLPELARQVADTLHGMRIAGGSVTPPLPGRRRPAPQLMTLSENETERREQFRQLRRSLLPGFALVSRDDLLQSHRAALRASQPQTDLFDAWLDLSRINHAPHWQEHADPAGGEPRRTLEWRSQRGHSQGWTVPMPVGYGAMSPLYPAGSVANARDAHTPFRFVESLYSLGEWVSPHRLHDVAQLLWYADDDTASGLYRCRNDYAATLEIED